MQEAYCSKRPDEDALAEPVYPAWVIGWRVSRASYHDSGGGTLPLMCRWRSPGRLSFTTETCAS